MGETYACCTDFAKETEVGFVVFRKKCASPACKVFVAAYTAYLIWPAVEDDTLVGICRKAAPSRLHAHGVNCLSVPAELRGNGVQGSLAEPVPQGGPVERKTFHARRRCLALPFRYLFSVRVKDGESEGKSLGILAVYKGLHVEGAFLRADFLLDDKHSRRSIEQRVDAIVGSLYKMHRPVQASADIEISYERDNVRPPGVADPNFNEVVAVLEPWGYFEAKSRVAPFVLSHIMVVHKYLANGIRPLEIQETSSGAADWKISAVNHRLPVILKRSFNVLRVPCMRQGHRRILLVFLVLRNRLDAPAVGECLHFPCPGRQRGQEQECTCKYLFHLLSSSFMQRTGAMLADVNVATEGTFAGLLW